MEVHVGGDTSQAKPPFSREQSREYFRQLCLGLEYLHHNEVVHRDVRPLTLRADDRSNQIIYSYRQTEKLSSFVILGYRKCLRGMIGYGIQVEVLLFSVQSLFKVRPSLLQVHGTELMVANTQEVHGKAVDIWALGTLGPKPNGRTLGANDRGDAVLYAYWETPFQCGEPNRSIRSSQNPRVRLPQVKADDRPLIPTDWPHDQADLVKRMLIKNPTDRIRMRDIRVRPPRRSELTVGTPMGDGAWCRGDDYKRRQFVLCRTTGRGAYPGGVGSGYSAEEGYFVSLHDGQS
jgi:[calcium/calmodulin-dependent protein kinase] kinase